jgi:hypothetical protein
MSEKELLYIEDVLNQIMLFQKKCRNYAEQMMDRELKAYCKVLETKAEDNYLRILKLLQ